MHHKNLAQVFCWAMLLFLSWGAAASSTSVAGQFFVSPDGNDAWSGRRATKALWSQEGPFVSLSRALSAARETKAGNPEQPVTIFLRGGTYFLEKPLVLTPADSHIAFIAYNNEGPVVSGGRRITGWKETRSGGRRLWVADLPEVRAGKWAFVELWTNGERAIRARQPNRGYLEVAGVPDSTSNWTDGQYRFKFMKSDVPAAEFLAGVEAVVMSRWVESRLPLLSVDYEQVLLNFAKRSVFQLGTGDLFYLEGAVEFVDVSGEWALDAAAGRIFYLPRPGERLAGFEAIAPMLTQVLRLEGRPEQSRFVEDVRFQGLVFSHTEWYFPGGFHTAADKPEIWPAVNPEVGGFAQAAIGVPGGVWGRGVRGSSFEQCRFTQLGTYGLELSLGCSSNRIVNCEFSHLGGGGIKIGETVVRSKPSEQSRGNLVTDCRIMDGGKLFHSAIGIWIGQSPDNRITHNLIQDFYYTGISIGWTWGYGPALATNNLVANNIVRHIGRRSDGDGPILSDMGGIYTLSMQPGTRIVNNLWHDIAGFRYGGWGIYFDEGSSSILAESNLVYHTTHGGFHQHYGATNVVRNNIFALARDHQIQRSRPESHRSFCFMTNIVYFNSGVLLGSSWADDKFQLCGNLYFDTRTAGSGKAILFAGGTFDSWRTRGHDIGSKVGDPHFVDPVRRDFRLQPGSPALEMGFKPLDLSNVGPWSGFFSPSRGKAPIDQPPFFDVPQPW